MKSSVKRTLHKTKTIVPHAAHAALLTSMPSAGTKTAENHVLQHRLQQSKGQKKLVD